VTLTAPDSPAARVCYKIADALLGRTRQ